MNIEDASKNDDFDAAFAQFAAPDDKLATVTTDNGGSSEGGDDGQAGDAGVGDQSGAAGDDDGAGGADAAGADQGAAGEAQAGEDGAQGAADGGAGEEGAQGGAGDDGSAAADAGGDAGAAVADAGAQTDAGPSADDILAGLKKLVGDAATAPTQGGGDQAAGGEAKAAEAKPIYSEEETEFLKSYDEDWATVVKGEALKRRGEYQALIEYIFQQVADFVSPINETANVLAERTFRTELTSAVPDYSDKLRENVVSWVKTQPPYLQNAYNQVITQGSVDEVKDLIDRYRTATGQVKQTAKPKSKGDELSDEAKKAAAQLAPVDSKRSGVQAPSDPSNFEDAWKQAAAGLG